MLQDNGATVVVMDDGLQQELVRAHVRIGVVDDRFPNAHGVIPAGYRRTLSVRPKISLGRFT